MVMIKSMIIFLLFMMRSGICFRKQKSSLGKGAFDCNCKILFGIFCFCKHDIYNDSEDKSASDRSKCYLAERDCQAADTRDKTSSYYEEVLVSSKVYLLYHLKTRNRDKSVKRNANAAHYAGRDRIDKSDEG